MDILEKLRAETRADHDELEAIGMSEKIMNGTIRPDEYKKLISVHYIVHKALEEKLKEAGVQELYPELDFQQRQKLGLIQQDLQELSVPEESLVEQQAAGKIPAMQKPYGLLGAMYVMEGATLGGMVIMKALKKNEHMQEAKAFHYFGCYGGNTGSQWKQFLSVLQDKGNSPEAQEQVVEAASETYQFFRDNFRKFL